MKKIALFFVVSAFFFSCKSKSETTTADTTKPQTDSVATAVNTSENKMCFLYVFNGKDSTKVSLTLDGENVTGSMEVLMYEKDSAIGTLKGKKVGDTITADYNFVIEGSNEIEEKIFVLQGDKLVEKVGELEFKNGKSIMKNPEKAENGDILTKVECWK